MTVKILQKFIICKGIDFLDSNGDLKKVKIELV